MQLKKQSGDFILFFIVILLLSLGVLMVFSSSSYAAYIKVGDPYYYLKRQVNWSLIGVTGMLIASKVKLQQLKRLATPMLLMSFVLLILVVVAGIKSHGASRWLGVGSLSLQPSEVIKLTMVIYMAKALSSSQEKIQTFKQGIIPNLMVLALAGLLIMLQPDLGTTVAVAGTFFLLLLSAGAKISHLSFLAAGGISMVIAAIILEPYRMRRFTAYLRPFDDPTGAGFQTIQSLLALGSGGLMGVGLGASRQKLLYVPERHTDFIFSILGEELGFLGTAVVIFLFFLFMLRGLKIAVEAPDAFSSLLAVGVTSMITLQAIINIGVVTGALPVTGITLPFISYGGSSLVFTLLSVGLLLNVSRQSVKG